MSLFNIKEFHGQSLGVKTPWKVTEVSIDSGSRQVHVLVEYAGRALGGHGAGLNPLAKKLRT